MMETVYSGVARGAKLTVMTVPATMTAVPNMSRRDSVSPSSLGASTVLKTRVSAPIGDSMLCGAKPKAATSRKALQMTRNMPSSHSGCL